VQSDLEQLRAAVASWFERAQLARFLGAGDGEIEAMGLDWLARSGKRWRPFLVAALDRACRDQEAGAPREDVKSVAIAVECIHKASLIYDDIQDDDKRRYGEQTLHRVHGVPIALTVSLYLLGQGYRLIAGCAASEAQRVEMLKLATAGHRDLCLGQGRELLWMNNPTPLTVPQVLDLFRWKTAPSFEVVCRLPAMSAGAGPEVHEVLRNFSHSVGVAYQVQDDLEDFHGRSDVDDVQARRPSVVLALAHELARGAAKAKVAEAWCGSAVKVNIEEVRRIIATVGAESKAREIIASYKRAALDALRPLTQMKLKVLLCRVTDKMLPDA
jgi:geranylgeranyl pyrophosphate synthase